jgi:hypothetical protein
MSVPSAKSQVFRLAPETLYQICEYLIPSVIDIGFINEVEELYITLNREHYYDRARRSSEPVDMAMLPEGLKPLGLLNTGWTSTTALLLSCKLLHDTASRCLHHSTTIRFQNPSMIPLLLQFEHISFEIGQQAVAWIEFLDDGIQNTLLRLKKLDITIIYKWTSESSTSFMNFKEFKKLCRVIDDSTAYVDDVTVHVRNIWPPIQETISSFKGWKEISHGIYRIKHC